MLKLLIGELPKVGDKLYVPSRIYISRGEDDILGGLATINKVIISDTLPFDHINSIMVSFEELPNRSMNYKILLEQQDFLKNIYYNQIARPDPDINTPFIQSGDLVNNHPYKGNDIFK